MCLLICSLREEDWLHEKLDCVHLCCFSPVWMREWVFKLHLNQMTCYTCGQLNFLTQLWVCLWLKKLPLFANVFGHTLQDICFVIFKYHLLIHLVFASDCHKRQLSLLNWNKDIRLDYVSRYMYSDNPKQPFGILLTWWNDDYFCCFRSLFYYIKINK